MQQKHIMKTKKQIQKKIKETKEKMINSEGGMFTYWLAYHRALEWALIKDKNMKEKQSSFPWGYTKVLTEGENYRVKRVSLNPDSRQSYQSHEYRAESWLILSGKGKITIDDKESDVETAAIVMISIGMKHRIENLSSDEPLVFIETQFGSYIGEDDIVRYEDDYGRHLDNWADCDADLL